MSDYENEGEEESNEPSLDTSAEADEDIGALGYVTEKPEEAESNPNEGNEGNDDSSKTNDEEEEVEPNDPVVAARANYLRRIKAFFKARSLYYRGSGLPKSTRMMEKLKKVFKETGEYHRDRHYHHHRSL